MATGRQPRSRRAALAAFSVELREAGWAWGDIASLIQHEQHVNARVAMRLARGWSQQTVADRWNQRFPGQDGERPLTAKKLSYWETWPASGRQPSVTTLARLAQLYECETKDLIDCTRPRAATAAPPVSAPESLLRLLEPLRTGRLSARRRDAVFARLVGSLGTWADGPDRRDMLRVLGWASLAAASAPGPHALDPDEEARVLRVLTTSARLDTVVVGRVEEVLHFAEQDDLRRGPRDALDIVLAQRNLCRVMLDHCPGHLRPRLLAVHAEACRIAGWLSFDLRDFRSATHFYELARHTAHEAGSAAIAARVLCLMSYLATWCEKPGLAIDHATAAMSWSARCDDPALRAFAADALGRAHSVGGEYGACMRALDSALRHLTAPGDKTTSAVFRAYDDADGQGGTVFMTTVRGLSLLRLGRHQEAATALTDAQAPLARGVAARASALTTLGLGLALARSGHVEHGTALLGTAADVAARNHSSRLLQRLRLVTDRLGSGSGVTAPPVVQQLRDRLAALSQ
ncbi:hypothetical protein [Streptomyces sp. URMC 129]|uniref:hypothetical protein n=1 Tax=Streptomyces sp. URMC 129 TaxID=3423407 RepID=UPI003F19E2F2